VSTLKTAYQHKPPKQVYSHAAQKKRVQWYDYFNAPERTRALLRKLGIKRKRPDFAQLNTNCQEVVSTRWKFTSGSSRARTERMVIMLAAAPQQLFAFDSLRRLSGSIVACSWLLDALIALDRNEVDAVKAKDNAVAARVEGVKRAALRREKRARTRLKFHMAQLKKEQRLVKHWRSKVAYYDKKKGSDGNA